MRPSEKILATPLISIIYCRHSTEIKLHTIDQRFLLTFINFMSKLRNFWVIFVFLFFFSAVDVFKKVYL